MTCFLCSFCEISDISASKILSLTESREDQVFSAQLYYSHGDILNMSLTLAASDSLSCLIQRPGKMVVSKAERNLSATKRINCHVKTSWALLVCMEKHPEHQCE